MISIAILVAFILGFLARRVGLPPLVGFLVGGFVLHAIGEDGGDTLPRLGEMGVYLLLFSIGLKLRPRSLLRLEVWGVASLHMAIVITLFGAAIYGLGAIGLTLACNSAGRKAGQIEPDRVSTRDDIVRINQYWNPVPWLFDSSSRVVKVGLLECESVPQSESTGLPRVFHRSIHEILHI